MTTLHSYLFMKKTRLDEWYRLAPLKKRDSFKKNVVMMPNPKIFSVLNTGGDFYEISRIYTLTGFRSNTQSMAVL